MFSKSHKYPFNCLIFKVNSICLVNTSGVVIFKHDVKK